MLDFIFSCSHLSGFHPNVVTFKPNLQKDWKRKCDFIAWTTKYKELRAGCANSPVCGHCNRREPTSWHQSLNYGKSHGNNGRNITCISCININSHVIIIHTDPTFSSVSIFMLSVEQKLKSCFICLLSNVLATSVSTALCHFNSYTKNCFSANL